jgi:hypothetical protein
MTQVHQLFARAAYDPERLKVLGRAYDQAWQSIANAVEGPPADVETARTALAKVILNLPSSEVDDAEGLANTALRVMASGYRSGATSGDLPALARGRP